MFVVQENSHGSIHGGFATLEEAKQWLYAFWEINPDIMERLDGSGGWLWITDPALCGQDKPTHPDTYKSVMWLATDRISTWSKCYCVESTIYEFEIKEW